MNRFVIHRRRFLVFAGAGVFVLAIAVIPAGRSLCLSALGNLIQTAEGLTWFPCWGTDRSFSLDRLDPTCPQCM